MIQKLDEAGFVAYIVGGSVRDFLLQRPIKDHDIATNATPDEICSLFPHSITVGKAFGVIKVPTGSAEVEVATFREDLEYRDHRHPTGVRFSGPEEDARRRDFTINALFYDPKTSRILDPTGGIDDLKAKKLRAIGDARTRFQEDALRLLRAVRFATVLGFEIEAETAKAIHSRAKLIAHVSGERIRDELTRMLMSPQSAEAMEMLAEFKLLKQILPEVDALRGVVQAPTSLSGAPRAKRESDIWATTLRTLRFLQKNVGGLVAHSVPLAWAALLYDVGKPVALLKNDGKNFNGHEIEGSALAREIGDRLRMPRADIERIAAMVEGLLKFRDVFKMREATLERFVRLPYFDEMLELHRAQASSSDGNLAFYEFCAFRRRQVVSSSAETPKLIDGKDLIQLGFMPGPEFSAILRTIEDLALERRLTTKEQALEYVVSHFVK
ncbi:MAG: CCA tRNA nucleotidyltransferase [Oligoflexia bacterium]|nr:CCA tRNA nucleotidyltransferase [Oligoflexia bacterium]